MKIQIFKTKRELTLFDLKNAICFGLFYIPMVMFMMLNLSWILHFALVSFLLGLLLIFNIRFFSNEKILVNDFAITFSNSTNLKIDFQKIERLDVLIDDKSFKTPIFLIIYFDNDYIIIRFDKFNFKNPKKEFMYFKTLLPENVVRKLNFNENEFISVKLESLQKK